MTSAIAAALGGGVRALKPIASGPDDDAARMAWHHPPLCHVHLREPLSPHRAAAMDGVRIDRATVLKWIRSNAGDPTLVEGCGGWEVPLAEGWRVSDLAVDLGWPVLIVARNRLGCLNYTLLTVDAVRARGLEIAAVVLNGPGAENLEDLRTLLDVPVHPFPWLPRLDRESLAEAGRSLTGNPDRGP